ncbi:MAG: GNAT family N-acetyltransferase [Methylocystis sp.]
MAAEFNSRVASSLASVKPAAWDACANAGRDPAERFNPFVSHAFLSALERSGSVGAKSGWTPAHALIEDRAGRLAAAAPTYVKAHSLGEYVFDQAFAEAYRHAGGRYYPKIQVSVPFTPVTGSRLLLEKDAPEAARTALIGALRALCKSCGASSLHFTFATEPEAKALATEGFLLRAGEQFHFINQGYRDFDDFLDALASRKRKTIKRERREALGADLTIELLTGSDIAQKHWDAFFAFYMHTGARKWGRPYLTRAFFDEIGGAMPERILLVMVRKGVDYIAGALNFLGDDAIYGRHWGALEERPFLHFEVCYHQAIDYAIRHGFQRVEAGAQGEHKLARGYRPVTTHSAHEFADPRLRAAVADYLARERDAVAAMIKDYEEALPFRRD